MTAEINRTTSALADLLHAASRAINSKLHVWRDVIEADGSPAEPLYRGALRIDPRALTDNAETSDAISSDSPTHD